MKIIDHNYISDEDARRIMEGQGYVVKEKEEASEEVVEENAKKGYPGVKGGTKKAKAKAKGNPFAKGKGKGNPFAKDKDEEDDFAVGGEEEEDVKESNILEYVEFEGETYGLSSDIYKDEEGDMFIRLLPPSKEDNE